MSRQRPTGSACALLAVTVLASLSAHRSAAQGMPPPSPPSPSPAEPYEKKIGTKTPIYVTPPFTTASGGIHGNIPIGFIGGSPTRNGDYYLPKSWQNTPLPVFVFLHGSGGDGNQQIGYWKSLADKYQFIIIAPDSHNSLYWFSPANANDTFTEDYWHVLACYNYVQALPGVQFNYAKISMGGNSRGGYSAASIASCTGFATHSTILHSRFIWQQMGQHIIPIWVSTGTEDPLFGPGVMRNHLAFFHSKRPQFKYTFRVFSGGHSMNNKLELESSIKWWYSTPGAVSVQGPANGYRRR